MTKSKIKELIFKERARQDAKWGKQRHQLNSQWMTILTEEIGEVAECVCKTEVPPVKTRARKIWLKNMKKELVQSAAVIFAWLESQE